MTNTSRSLTLIDRATDVETEMEASWLFAFIGAAAPHGVVAQFDRP